MLLKINSNGIYCEQANLYIDPWKGVDKAIITHAHSDHARWGSKNYLAHTQSEGILKHRLGATINLQTLNYNEQLIINGVKISLHPAGHIIGSAQVRLEYNNQVWVASGDYKTFDDGITAPFEPIKCNHFITESTFGMPVYNFEPPEKSYSELVKWVNENHQQNINSVLIGYSLGKAQRILHALKNTNHKIILHNSVYETNNALNFSNANYIRFSVDLPKETFKNCVIVAPPALTDSAWLKRFEPYKLAICSGWMQIRGWRRRSNADKGFAISDHADWKSLNTAIAATQAENIYVTHGYKAVLAKYLRDEKKLNAFELDTLFEGETITKNEDLA